jgi:hypothetical protein
MGQPIRRYPSLDSERGPDAVGRASPAKARKLRHAASLNQIPPSSGDGGSPFWSPASRSPRRARARAAARTGG